MRFLSRWSAEWVEYESKLRRRSSATDSWRTGSWWECWGGERNKPTLIPMNSSSRWNTCPHTDTPTFTSRELSNWKPTSRFTGNWQNFAKHKWNWSFSLWELERKRKLYTHNTHTHRSERQCPLNLESHNLVLAIGHKHNSFWWVTWLITWLNRWR